MLSYKFFVIQWKVKKGEKKEFQDDKECTEKHTILLLKFPLFTYEDKQSIITLWKMMGKHTTSARFLKKKKNTTPIFAASTINHLLFNHVSGSPFKNLFSCSLSKVTKTMKKIRDLLFVYTYIRIHTYHLYVSRIYTWSTYYKNP